MVRHASGYRSAARTRRENRKVRRTWRYNLRVKATLGSSSLPELSPMPMGPRLRFWQRGSWGAKAIWLGMGRRTRPKARDVGAGVSRPSKDRAKRAAAPRRS